MGAADAYQHTDSNRNDDGSYVVHGTLKSGNRVWRIIVKPYIITNDYKSGNRVWRIIVKPYIITNDYNTEGDPMRFFC